MCSLLDIFVALVDLRCACSYIQVASEMFVSTGTNHLIKSITQPHFPRFIPIIIMRPHWIRLGTRFSCELINSIMDVIQAPLCPGRVALGLVYTVAYATLNPVPPVHTHVSAHHYFTVIIVNGLVMRVCSNLVRMEAGQCCITEWPVPLPSLNFPVESPISNCLSGLLPVVSLPPTFASVRTNLMMWSHA